MKKNMGLADRVIRISLSALFVALYFARIISGTWAYILLAIATVLLFTSLVSVCPLYSLLGLSTCKKKIVE